MLKCVKYRNDQHSNCRYLLLQVLFIDSWLHIMEKIPNHLASKLEQRANAIGKLPAELKQQLFGLKSATTQIKHSLFDCLPEEILDNLWVVKLTDTHITIGVQSATAANHIQYMQQSLVEILNQDKQYFGNLTSLKAIFVPIPKK